MTAYYPSQVKNDWTRWVDLKDVVYASHVNTIYDEVEALERYLGADVHKSGTWGAGASFDSATVVWSSAKARIQNLENGIYEVYTDRVKSSGGSIVLPTTDVVNLTLQAKSSQTSNTLNVKNSAGVTLYSVGTAAGTFTGVLDGGNA